MIRILFSFMLFTVSNYCFSQAIENNSNTILVKNSSFTKALNTLLDLNYEIEKKDIELQTAYTVIKRVGYDSGYRLRIRMKDSVIYINGYITWPWKEPLEIISKKQNPLDIDKEVYYETNKKGKHKSNTTMASVFDLMLKFANQLGNKIEFANQ